MLEGGELSRPSCRHRQCQMAHVYKHTSPLARGPQVPPLRQQYSVQAQASDNASYTHTHTLTHTNVPGECQLQAPHTHMYLRHWPHCPQSCAACSPMVTAPWTLAKHPPGRGGSLPIGVTAGPPHTRPAPAHCKGGPTCQGCPWPPWSSQSPRCWRRPRGRRRHPQRPPPLVPSASVPRAPPSRRSRQRDRAGRPSLWW